MADATAPTVTYCHALCGCPKHFPSHWNTTRYWRVVDNETGGITFSVSENDRHLLIDDPADRAEAWRQRMGAKRHHIEVWDRHTPKVESRWERVE